MNAEFVAGLLSGVAGLAVFLIIHHFWIKPIWFILPPGLFIAGLGGLAVGWSYAEIRVGLPPRPWTALAIVVLIFAILAPAIILAQLREPTLDLSTFTIPRENAARAALVFVVDLLVTATIVGALAGWLIGRTQSGMIATAIAGFVFALGPGHNIPFLGNTPVVGKGLLLLLAIIVVSAIVLVEASAALGKPS